MNKEVMNNRRKELDQKINALAIENAQIFELRNSLKTQVLENVFSGLELMEGTKLAINERSVQLINTESGYDLAKLTVDRDFVSNGFLGERKTVINFRFNGGSTEEVKFLSSMAKFIEVASSNKEFILQEFEKANSFMSEVKKENQSEIRILEREDSNIRTSMIKEVEDNILAQMKSEKGFDLVATKRDTDEEFPFINRDGLKVSFNFTVNQLSNLKILSMTKSGKTATVEITQNFNDRVSSFIEKVRMSNIESLITRQRHKMEDVERGDVVFA